MPLQSASHDGCSPHGFRGLHSFNRDSARLLPVSFFNAEGKWESGSVPALLAIHEDDSACSYAETAAPISGARLSAGGVEPLPRSSACERLRRTLFETGQLLVTTEDGLSRVWFAGVGDPDVLFVEVVPRDATPAQEAEHAFPGCVCSLREAEALLGRIYEGESSAQLTRLVERIRSEMKF